MPTCAECDTEPTPGVHVEALPARHTLLTAEGPAQMCSWCLVQLVLGTERYGSRVTLSVAPALIEVA